MKRTEGFVALLDVLGFRNIVGHPASEKRLSAYLKAVEEVISGKGDTRAIDFVLFSDSIVITTDDDSDLSLRTLLRACSRLIGALLENGIAVRGAVSHGSFFRESRSNGVFLAGRPIVEAYESEQKQNWLGVIATPSVLDLHRLAQRCVMRRGKRESVADLGDRLPWILLLQRCGSIPFEGATLEGLAVVPTPVGNDLNAFPSYIKKCRRKVEELKLLAPEPRAQGKYISTATWLGEVSDRWSAFVKSGGLPPTVNYY
jgi:hypothetical protein